jgi:16S rRNA (guanine527-N7)-methyltransferase
VTGDPQSQELRQILLESRDLGFLGPGPIDAHLEHAWGFVEAAEGALGHAPTTFLDLGTGGGVPGLVLALAWPGALGVFVESATRRAAALQEWMARLRLTARTELLPQRAETVGRDPTRRERAELVTARSFAPPPVTAEIAAALVALGGALVVSEPPEANDARWPSAELATLGFAPAVLVVARDSHFVVLRKTGAAPPTAPRAVGRPAKRPLW